MSQAKKSELAALLGPTIEALGLELWGIEYLRSRGHGLLRIYIDHAERPITLEDCEVVSREVSASLDVADPISGQYTLEVSSPGLDRPLFEAAHYLRFVGHDAKVQLLTPLAGRKRFQGRIDGVAGNTLTLIQDGVPTALPINDIEKARLVPRFDKAAPGMRRAGG
jgi:ribosome maturation factor RimP